MDLYYQTGQFAKKASVTIRTLRYYDQIGLLSPSHHTKTGHRLYTDHDLFRLEQILALKYLGFPLSEIKTVLDEGPQDIKQALALQKRMVKEKLQQMRLLLSTIEHAEHLLSDGQLRWKSIIQLIQAVQMSNQHGDLDWRKYYSEEAAKKVEERQKTYTAEEAARDQLRWEKVIATFKQAYAQQLPFDHPTVKEAAQEWQQLIYEFTQGDPAIFSGLKKTYEEGVFSLPYSEDEGNYINRALEYHQQTKDGRG
ncbi:MerR family transcriptional regulator [Laceyella putida]|uniref:MerR family transcriptional regulator n=1 Tax=Laceyella putida TaxID=110101 RepID=UPI003625E128